METYHNLCAHSHLNFQVGYILVSVREKVYGQVVKMERMSRESSCASSLANSVIPAGRQTFLCV